jgi:predicted enzyme related to lactoylglutathione lyase
MPRVVHFEIYAEDPERAVQFYQEVFGWKVQKWDGVEDYWLVTTGEEAEPGIDGAIARRTKDETTYNIVDIPSVDETTEKVLAAGGKVVSPKFAVPGQGYVAYYQDTEGVVFGVMQADPSAK